MKDKVTRGDIAVAIALAMNKLDIHSYTVLCVENSELTKWCVHKADNPLGEVILTQATGLAPSGWLQFVMRVDPFEQPELAREWGRIVRQVREEIEFHTLTGDYWGKVRQEWPKTEQPAQLDERETAQVPPWLPKRPETCERWRQAYQAICKMRQDLEDDWEIRIPTLAECRDCLAESMKWKPSEKTISRIIRAGDAGLL